MGLRSGRGRCRRFRSDRFAGYFRRASTLDFSSKEVAPAVLHAERKRDVTCRDENKLSPYFFFFLFFFLFVLLTRADPADTTLQKRADAPSAWELVPWSVYFWTCKYRFAWRCCARRHSTGMRGQCWEDERNEQR